MMKSCGWERIERLKRNIGGAPGVVLWLRIRYRSLTKVLDPFQVSVADIARFYKRRWDIEMAFGVLKELNYAPTCIQHSRLLY